MNNKKVISLVNRIEADLRKLAELTGEEHISAFVVDNNFILTSFKNEHGQTTLDFYREGGGENGKDKECTTDSI